VSWTIWRPIIYKSKIRRGGVINSITGFSGAEPMVWMTNASIFRQLVIGTEVWKEFGCNAVIFPAALTGINPNLYEAAAIDGAGRLRSTRHCRGSPARLRSW
jgi:putative aldouronate transport system permease protein